MSKAEFLEKLANPNKAKILEGFEHFLNQYGTMIATITYISYDKGTHNIMLVASHLDKMVLEEFMIQMNVILPNAEITSVISVNDSDTKHGTHIIQIREQF